MISSDVGREARVVEVEAPSRKPLRGRQEDGSGRQLASLRPTRVVCIGGGTGLPAVLRGLARYAGQTRLAQRLHLTAVVAMSDNGGSSGKLREQLSIVPPGDVRNCLVALARGKSALGEVFQYRFGGDSTLKGHTIGNLVLAALAQSKGDFLQAVRISGELLGARGTVLPSTLRKVDVVATLEDGRAIVGERGLSRSGGKVARLELLPRAPPAAPGVLSAIRSADLIVLGPGSLYTSLLPNLLVEGVSEALRESRGLKVLVGNMMTQAGETDGMTGGDHVRAVLSHAGRVIDAVLVNRAVPSAAQLERYAGQGGFPISYDRDEILAAGIVPIEKDVLNVGSARIRHDSRKLAGVLLQLAEAARSPGTHRA